MITKKQRRRLHTLEQAEKTNVRRYQRLSHLEGMKLPKHSPRWRKCYKACDYRGKAYFLFWED